MGEGYLEIVAECAEQADNLFHASKIPFDPKIHVEQLAKGLKEIRDKLRDVYINESGEDPWEGHPAD